MKQQNTISPVNPFARVLNLLTLLGSLVILITLSHDIIYSRNYTLSNSLLHLQLYVCLVFMADWVAGVTFAERPVRWAFRNLFWLLVSLPWLNILRLIDAGDISMQLEVSASDSRTERHLSSTAVGHPPAKYAYISLLHLYNSCHYLSLGSALLLRGGGTESRC